MTASDYIKNQPHLQGKSQTTQNPFTVLAEFPPLSYSKAVTTETKGENSNPTPNPTQKSAYYTKPQKQHLMTTHFTKPINLRQLQTFTNRVFYDDSLYPTDNLTKNRTFYEYILVDSGSVEITHYPDRINTSYSTCKILRVCSIQDLGFIHHHTIKPFSTPGYHIKGYSYVDYQNAFFRTFYVKSYDHSWFLSFDQKCNKNIPGWFNEWWYWLGPSDQIYPPEIIKTSFPYYKKQVPDQPVGPITKIAFHIDMGIPWICSWHFSLELALPDMPYSLIREYRIKWWEKYNLDRCSLTNIQKYFQISKQTETDIQTISKSIPLLTPNQLMHQTKPSLPTTTSKPESKKAQTDSPTHSSTSSNSKKSSKKDILKKLLAELMNSSDEEDIMPEDDPYGGPLSQDPFEI